MEQGKDVRDNAPSIAPFAGGDETVRFRRDTGISSWKTFSKLRRRIRFAVRLCPLSALFGTPVCNLTFLNFCISYRFVFLEERTAVACFSFVYRLHLVCFVKGNSLFPLTILSAKLSQLDRSSPFGGLPLSEVLTSLPFSLF